MQALKDLRSLLTDCVEKGPLEGNPRAEALLSSLQSLEKALSGAGEEARKALLARVEEALTGGLPGRLRTLWAGLKAREVTEETLPQGLRSYWKGEGGEFRVEVHPAKDLFSDGALQEFVRTVQSVTPEAIGLPVIMVEAGDTVLRAFQTAGILSLLAILLILLLALERKADIPLVLVPLLLSASVTGALCVLMDIPINFANIIALPLILGIGVDNGIHVVQRFRHADPGDPDVLKRSTSRAMVFSALTTLCGFGNLAFCAHRGMASMGLVLFLGILVTLLMTLFVLPALLVRSRETAPADAP